MQRSARSSEAEPVSPVVLLLVLVLVLMPIPRVLVKFTPGNGAYDFQAILFPSDLPLAVLTIVMIPRIVRRIRDGSLGILAWLALALTAWMAVAFVVHPSRRGVADVLRLLGLVATVVALLELKTTGERGIVLGSMAAVAAFESAVSVIQIATRSSAGLGALGASANPLWSFGSTTAAQGAPVHP